MNYKYAVIGILALNLSMAYAGDTVHISTFLKMVRNKAIADLVIIKAYENLSTLDVADADNLLKVYRNTSIAKLRKAQKPATETEKARDNQPTEQDFDWGS